MNIHFSEAKDGDTRLAHIILSERNIAHLVKASLIFDINGVEPFLKRFCEDGTMLLVAATAEGDPQFDQAGTFVSASIPVEVLSSLKPRSSGDSEPLDAYLQGDILWTVSVERDDEHYERREAGPGFAGIV